MLKRKIEIIFGILAIFGGVSWFIGVVSDDLDYIYIGIIFLSPIILCELWAHRTSIIQWILKHRKTCLFFAGILGIVLAYGMHKFFPYEHNTSNPVLHSSLTILVLGLPTFFVLWLFRTHDVQENIDNSTLFECARMLTEKYPEVDTSATLPQKIALEQLAYLKRETGFNKKRIDLLTQGLILSRIHLIYVCLDGIDLSRFNLCNANLKGADLSNANLSNADMSNIDLSSVDLRCADLRGADLTNFIDDGKTKWKGAFYSSTTKFNGTRLESIASRKKEGMIDEYGE